MPNTALTTFVVAELVLGIITALGNGLVLLAVFRFKSLQTVPNVFLANLAMADVCVGIIVTPVTIFNINGYPRNDVLGCIVWSTIILVFLNTSILMLLTIAIERFIAIRFPILYIQHGTLRSSVVVITFVWILGAFSAFLPLFRLNIAPDEMPQCDFKRVFSNSFMVYYQFFVMTLLPLIVMIIAYVYIFLVVREHSAGHLQSMEKLFKHHSTADNHLQWRQDVEVAKMFAICILFFALLWLPINIVNTIEEFCTLCKGSSAIKLFAISLSHANSMINPFVYAANSSNITYAVVVMLGIDRYGSTTTVPIGTDTNTRQSRYLYELKIQRKHSSGTKPIESHSKNHPLSGTSV